MHQFLGFSISYASLVSFVLALRTEPFLATDKLVVGTPGPLNIQNNARGYEGMFVTYLDMHAHGVRVVRRLLELVPRMYHTMDGAALADVVRDILLKYGLEWSEELRERIIALVSDTASDVSSLARILDVPHHKCLDHVIDLGLEDCDVSDTSGCC